MAQSRDDHRGGPGLPIASFGAALSALMVPPNVDAAIMSLTPNPGTVPYLSNYGVTLGVGGTGTYDFFQFNDSVGKTILGGTNIPYFLPVSFSNTITTGQPFTAAVFPSFSATGTAIYGFLTQANQVGWIQLDFGGPGGPVTYLAAAFNDTPGGAIGAGKVPEPESLPLMALGVLALGAAGIRARRRAQTKPAATAA